MNTSANLKQNLKKSVKQFTNEPLELLKSARRQVTGEEIDSDPDMHQNKSDPDMHQNKSDPEIPQDLQKEEDYKQQKAESDGRTLQALESELKDIRRQKLFQSLMERIQNGENVPLEEFAELSYEQKDVLKAQIEAVRTRNSSPATEKSLIEPMAKKGRQLFGQKQSAHLLAQARKQTTRVEKPVPPSG